MRSPREASGQGKDLNKMLMYLSSSYVDRDYELIAEQFRMAERKQQTKGHNLRSLKCDTLKIIRD